MNTQAGTRYQMITGDYTTPYPNLSKRSHKGDSKKLNAWLIENAKIAASRGNWMTEGLHSMNPGNFSQSDSDECNLFMFGEINSKFADVKSMK